MIFPTQKRAQQYYDLFINRTDIWFRQWIDRDGGAQYCCVKPGDKNYEPVTLDLVWQHLDKKVTASWPAISEAMTCKWACWDCDTESGALSTVATILETWGFHPLQESKRPGREGHLWLFFDQPVPAASLVRFNQEVMAHAQLTRQDIEFFPKSATKMSQVRGPLGINQKPEAQCRGWFENAPLTVPAQIDWLCQQPKNSSEVVGRIVELLCKNDKISALRHPRCPRSSEMRSEGVDILSIISDRRWRVKEWIAQCPLCAIEGHDKHRDNLRINKDGSLFTCVYGGPGEVHKAKDIVAALSGK